MYDKHLQTQSDRRREPLFLALGYPALRLLTREAFSTRHHQVVCPVADAPQSLSLEEVDTCRQ